MRQRCVFRLLGTRPRATRAPALPLLLQRLIPRPSSFAHSSRTSHQYQPYQHPGYSSPSPPPPHSEAFPFKRSWKARLVRSIAWALLFGFIGLGTTLGFRIGYYLKANRVKVDSKLDNRLALENTEFLDKNNPAILALKNDPEYIEVWPLATDLETMTSPEDKQTHHFVVTALRGFRGVFPRVFYNESHSMLVMVVDFGHGVDNDLGAIHSGVITSMVHEAVEILAQAYFGSEYSYKLSDLHLAFMTPIYYGTSLSITVMPSITVGNWSDAIAEARADAHAVAEIGAVYPDWVDPDDWNQRNTTFVCQVSKSRSHPKDPGSESDGVMCGVARFEVEGDGWPPPAPSSWPHTYYNMK